MRTFKDFIDSSTTSLNESNAELLKMVILKNKGREGKAVLGLADGKEIKNTIYLGDGYTAKKEGSTVVISAIGQQDSYIALKHFDVLKKSSF